MKHIYRWQQLDKGDSIVVVEHDRGNINTFQGTITDIAYGEITLNDAFSFTTVLDNSQYILRLPDESYHGKHRLTR